MNKQNSAVRTALSLCAVFLFSLAASLTFLSCATTSFAGPGPYSVPEDFFGISPDRSPLNKEDFEVLDDFGAVWIRSTARWTGVEKQEGVWDFSDWDVYVNKALATGKKVILILGFDSKWLYPDNKEHRDLGERELPYFLNYVEQMVNHFRGRVTAFEIWNEPNWFFWKGTDKHFFALSAAAAVRAKEVDPQAVILAGSTFRVSPGFMRGMFRAGAFDHVDGISLHPYASDALHTVRQVDKLRKIMAEFNCDKPVWITEVGYATGGIYFSFNKLERYPEYIVKTLSGLAARGVRNVLWYELMDEYNRAEVPDRWNPSHFFGLIYPDKSLKPGAQAFMLTTRYLRGTEYRPELPLRDGITDSITGLCFIRNGAVPDGNANDGAGGAASGALILWNKNRSTERIRLGMVDSVDGANNTGTQLPVPPPVLFRHDILTGEAAPLPEEPVLDIGRDPVFITWTGGGLQKPLLEKAGLRKP